VEIFQAGRSGATSLQSSVRRTSRRQSAGLSRSFVASGVLSEFGSAGQYLLSFRHQLGYPRRRAARIRGVAIIFGRCLLDADPRRNWVKSAVSATQLSRLRKVRSALVVLAS